MKELRHIEDQLGLRSSGCYTLILVKGKTGERFFANNVQGKEDIVKAFNPDTDLMMLAWTGQWKTDIFEVTEKNLQECFNGYEKLKAKNN